MRVLDQVITKAQAVVPMQRQIQALHLFQHTKSRLIGDDQPRFTESAIPDVADLDLTDIDVSDPFLWRQGQWEAYFRRLRDEAPVHYRGDSKFGPFWSVTRYDDIVTVDKDFETFSAEPQIILGTPPEGLDIEMFIAMDPPRHDQQRGAVQGVVAPQNLEEMESLIRERVAEVLDELPVDEPFDWVDRVSIELTSRMLATLLDFPYEERRKLVEWTDLVAASASATGGSTDTDAAYRAAAEAAKSFSDLWHDKAARRNAGEKPGYDLITLMQMSEDTKDLIERPMEFLGNIVLLVIGGNDTTRNSMTGGLLALNQFPEQFDRLRDDPSLVSKAVHEMLRWQTPLAYMRRIATRDTVLNGQFIRKGDKVVMWYASANRDERTFADPDSFIVDRRNARHHLAFGIGTHRCMGSRLAELQLRILWEELLARFDDIEVLAEPERVQSNFVRGYSSMMVQLTPKGAQRRQHGTYRAMHQERRRGEQARAAETSAPAPAPAPARPQRKGRVERTVLDVQVSRRRDAADGVVELTLTAPSGEPLPQWAPGAHAELHLRPDMTRHYSLCGDPADRSSWTVAVLREPDGRGGSAFVHDELTEGTTLRVTGPDNHFALVESPRYLFIAGGIGITPIRTMIAAADAHGAKWEMVYVGKSRSTMAFLDELEGDDRVTVWAKDERGTRFDLDTLLADPRPDTLVYCCGPDVLLDAVEERCAVWPAESLHLERFAPKAIDAPEGALDSFEVECVDSGVTVTVPAGTSMFEAVEEAGVDVMGSCMEGICGTCQAEVLDGTPDHRDSVLTRAERDRGDSVMLCVSRSLSSKLVLDL